MDFIYKWQVSVLLFNEYCIMHIVMEAYYTDVWCVDVQHLSSFSAVFAPSFLSDVNVHSDPCIGGLLLLTM